MGVYFNAYEECFAGFSILSGFSVFQLTQKLCSIPSQKSNRNEDVTSRLSCCNEFLKFQQENSLNKLIIALMEFSYYLGMLSIAQPSDIKCTIIKLALP